MSLRRRASPSAGFTLIEVSIAVMLIAMILGFVYEILWGAVRDRDAITEELESPRIESAIMDMIARDFRFLYYQPGLLAAGAGFRGVDKMMKGNDADRVDFLTCRTSRAAELEDALSQPGDSPLTEVGYACRPSDTHDKWLELWRREDFFVDDEPVDGGKFSLVYDKIRRFNLRYYPPPDDPTANQNKEGLNDWNSTNSKKVPYAIILDLWYDIREPKEGDKDDPQAKVTKIILIKPARSIDPDAGMAGSGSAMR